MNPEHDTITTAYGLIEVPVDPYDLLMCDSCQ